MMHPAYRLDNADEIPSPALVVYKPLVAANIAAAVVRFYYYLALAVPLPGLLQVSLACALPRR